MLCDDVGTCMLQHGNGKKSGRGSWKPTPPIKKISVSGTAGVAQKGGEPNLSPNLMSVYLCMNWWAIEIENRLMTGFVVGVEFYRADVELEDAGEFRLHLGLLSINFLWL